MWYTEMGHQQFSGPSALKYSKLVQQSRKSPLPGSSPSTSKAPGLFGTGKDGLLSLQWQQYPQTHPTFLARQEWATHPILSPSTPKYPQHTQHSRDKSSAPALPWPQSVPQAHQVHDNIFVEGIPPLSRHTAHVDHGLWIICIHVEDGCVDHPCHVSGVRGGASHSGVCGKANLQGQMKSDVPPVQTFCFCFL